MFHYKDMGEIWHTVILAELTCELQCEEHINHIKCKKCTKMSTLFGYIIKQIFFAKNWKSTKKISKQRNTSFIRCTEFHPSMLYFWSKNIPHFQRENEQIIISHILDLKPGTNICNDFIKS